LIETTDVCERAERTAISLRDGLRLIVVEEGVPWGVYGQASDFHIFPNPAGVPVDPMQFDPVKLGFKGLKGARNVDLAYRIRVALLAEGVDVMGGPGGLVSATHGAEEVARTLEAFRRAVRQLKSEGDIRKAA